MFGAVESFIALFPMHTDLRQGRWQTDESFFIRYAYGEGLLFTAAIFHKSIALMARLVEPGAATAIDLDELVMGPSPKFGIAILDPIGVAKQILPVPHRQSLV